MRTYDESKRVLYNAIDNLKGLFAVKFKKKLNKVYNDVKDKDNFHKNRSQTEDMNLAADDVNKQYKLKVVDILENLLHPAHSLFSYTDKEKQDIEELIRLAEIFLTGSAKDIAKAFLGIL